MFMSFLNLGEFSAIISSNNLSFLPFSFFSVRNSPDAGWFPLCYVSAPVGSLPFSLVVFNLFLRLDHFNSPPFKFSDSFFYLLLLLNTSSKTFI